MNTVFGESLTARDRKLLLAGLGASLLFGLLGQFLHWSPRLDIQSIYVMMVPALAGVYFISQSLWGGQLERSLRLIGTGLIIHILLFIPMITWHIRGLPSQFGLNPATLYVFYHGVSALGFLLITYGFYRLWKSV